MFRHIASNAFTVGIVGLVVLGGLITWGQQQYTGAGPLEEAICLNVPRGASMSRVADDLAAQGAISSASIYRLGADYTDRNAGLKAGSFLIEPGSSMVDILDTVTGDGLSTCGTEVIYRVSVNGQSVRVRELDPATQDFKIAADFDPAEEEVPQAYLDAKENVGTRFRITIAEGATSWRVVQGLSETDLLVGEIAEVPEEGTLAPDSYEVRPGDDRASVIARMASLQAERVNEVWASRSEDSPVETPEEALILASIIEKETGVAEERRLVASVFANRLEQGIKLQTDPTVIYGITRGEGVLGRGLRRSELRRETPWNTYVIDGLPPTPIANPGLESLRAALDPDDTDFIFFVADGTGGHAFAETLEEHNANVAKWRQIEAERAAASEN